MKFKMIGILSLVLLAALTLSAVCAADNNATDEMMGMENTQDAEAIALEQSNEEQVSAVDSNQSANSDAQSNDLLGKSIESEDALSVADATPVLGAAITAPTKLSASNTQPTKLTAKKTKYIKFKGKSKYTWKIKKTTWNKMKKQAIKWYKQFRKVGSYHPGYSDDVKVKVKRGGHTYIGYAMAVRNYKGIRCEVRGLPTGERATNWGDYR